MRISDWSSDVCSSDLAGRTHSLPMKKLLRSRLISFSRESRAGAGVCKFVIMDVGQADPRLGQRVDARIDHRRRPAHIALRAGAGPFKRLRDIVGDEAAAILGVRLLREDGRSEEHTSGLQSLMPS